MSQSGSWVPKGINQNTREAAREAAISEGLTLGEYLERLMNTPAEAQPNEVSAPHDQRRPHTEATSEALEKLTRRIEASEARSAMAITGLDSTIHDLVARLENSQETTAAIAGHVDGMIDQLRETHDALKQKVRRLEEDDSQQQNLEALKALESALSKLANHVYEENSLAQEEAQAIKGRVESGFMDIIERVETIETRVESGIEAASQRVKEGIEKAELRAAGTTRHLSERLSSLESDIQERFSATEGAQIRQEATEARLENLQTDLSNTMDSMEISIDVIQDRLNRAESTTDTALRNLETSFSSLDERIDDVASKVDPDLAGRLRSEFEARFEDLMNSVRETVGAARQELAEEINRTAVAPAEAAISELRETLDGVQTRLADSEQRETASEERLKASEARVAAFEERLMAGEERQASAIETVSGQVSDLNETLDTRLREVEERSDSAASEAVRTEIENLGKTVSHRIDELAEELSQRVADSETRSASAIEQIGDQVAAASNRLQTRQNEAIKTLAEQVDENRKKADARLSDALANVSERLETMQAQAAESLSPVQRAIASLATRLENLEDITSPPSDAEAAFTADMPLPAPTIMTGFDDNTVPDASLDEFEPFEAFDELEDFADSEDAPEEDVPDTVEAHTLVPEAEAETQSMDAPEAPDDDAVAFEADADYAGAEGEATDETAGVADVFEAGIESWETATEDLPEGATGNDMPEAESDTSFEDDFDAIRAAVEGLSFAHQEGLADDVEDEGPEEGAAADVFTDAAPVEEAEEAGLADDSEDPFLSGLSAEEDVDADLIETDNASEADTFVQIDLDNDTPKLAVPLDPLDALEGLDEAHTEARESDIFDDEEFEVMELPPAAEVPKPEAEKTLDADTADYLTRARRAAMLASKSGGKQARAVTGRASAGASRLPLIAAASAIAVAGVAAGGYLYIRGKQDAPVQAAPADTYVDPGAATAAVATASAALTEDPATDSVENDLFGPVEAAQASTVGVQYAPVPRVVTVKAAAAAGNYIAQFQLAQDKLAAGDYAQGAELMRRAAQKDLPIAQYALAKLHEKGTGVPKDLTLAREWTEKAARGGNVKAMHDLAVFMAEGEGGEQSYAGAVEWFRKGAEYGVVDSQYNLGVLYEQGIGISPNLTEALFWFDVANRNGDGGAPARISDLIERVSTEAAAQARSRAAAWQPSPANAIANGRFGAQIWNMGNPLQVHAIQKALNALGYTAGAEDGIMGAATAQAIRDYQAANNLPVTGTVTEPLIETLNAGATPE